jgi:FdhD protein
MLSLHDKITYCSLMKNLVKSKILEIKGDEVQFSNQHIISEEPLQININGKPFTIAMRTPGHDAELTRGLLYTEGVIQNNSDIEHLEKLYHPNENIPFAVTVRIAQYDEIEFMRTGIANASCGICGKKELNLNRFSQQKTPLPLSINLSQIKLLRDYMQQHQPLFQLTGGCHAAAIFDEQYSTLCVFEDVGRHNAVDKGIGFLLEKQLLAKAKILFLSGRVSFEILYKAYSVGISYILAISAPSSMSIQYAEKYGICIIGFCRDNNATVYSCQEKFSNEPVLS